MRRRGPIVVAAVVNVDMIKAVSFPRCVRVQRHYSPMQSVWASRSLRRTRMRKMGANPGGFLEQHRSESGRPQFRFDGVYLAGKTRVAAACQLFSLSPRLCTAILRLTVKKQIVINNDHRRRTAFRANSAARWYRAVVELSRPLTPQQANKGTSHTGDFVRKDTQVREPSVSRIYLRPEVLGKEYHG